MNYYYPHNQISYVFSMLIIGIIVGFFDDVFKMKRKLLPSNKVVIIIDDIVLSLLSVFIFIVSVFLFNNGIIRWYSVVITLLGFLLYKKTLSIPITYSMFFIINIVHRICKLVLFPFHKPYNLIYGIFKRRIILNSILNDRWLK